MKLNRLLYHVDSVELNNYFLNQTKIFMFPQHNLFVTPNLKLPKEIEKIIS